MARTIRLRMMDSSQAHPHSDYMASKIGMWLFLFTEVVLFGGLFLLYSIYRTWYSADFHESAKELDVFIGAVNTVVLITSSMTMAMSISALQRGMKRLSIILLSSTMFFALVFLVNKYFEWSAKFEHHIYPGSEQLLAQGYGKSLFFSLYFVMTGLHGFHVIVGFVLLAVVLKKILSGKVHKDHFIFLENSGLYWHLVDLVWIYLFPLFYLIT
jgi:cytochrome c oxidase subunit 3